MKFDLYNDVLVRITPRGEQAWASHFAAAAAAAGINIPISRDAEGWTRMPLWEVMQVFGPYMRNGAEHVIESVIAIPPQETKQ